jgi:hypothetical protein
MSPRRIWVCSSAAFRHGTAACGDARSSGRPAGMGFSGMDVGSAAAAGSGGRGRRLQTSAWTGWTWVRWRGPGTRLGRRTWLVCGRRGCAGDTRVRRSETQLLNSAVDSNCYHPESVPKLKAEAAEPSKKWRAFERCFCLLTRCGEMQPRWITSLQFQKTWKCIWIIRVFIIYNNLFRTKLFLLP